MDMTTYMRNEVRKHVFRTGSFTKPSALYFALHTGDPGAAGSANEVSTGGGSAYARVALDPLDANWSAEATHGETKNQSDITFPVPGANWGTVSYMSIWDAVSGGNCLMYGALVASKNVNAGDPAPLFPTGDVVVSFT